MFTPAVLSLQVQSLLLFGRGVCMHVVEELDWWEAAFISGHIPDHMFVTGIYALAARGYTRLLSFQSLC